MEMLRDPVFALLKVGTPLATDVEHGAATGIWLAYAHGVAVKNGGGGYWDRMRREFGVADKTRDEILARLWKRWQRDPGVEWTFAIFIALHTWITTYIFSVFNDLLYLPIIVALAFSSGVWSGNTACIPFTRW